MHVPDRVLRQFTLSQHIPDPVEQINRRRRPTSHRTDWAVVRAAYIDRWVQRWDCIQDTRPTAVDYTTYIRWYWGITRRWITRDPQPLAGHMPRPPTDSYIPSGMNERDYVRVLDSIDADIDAHVTEIQDQVALGLLSRIKKSIAQVFHKTHVDEFAGREDRSRSFGRAYARRRRPRDDDAGTSHADGAGTSHVTLRQI
ncbi:serine/threonine-protein phosphatase 7 long form homolog [Asparagus officinalis]|uniref:serine/threonine-protein phosphatase 7 long form homolog n=1 Tax=Asparagus officinalis TaxID=4686 RepID=UPI00098E41B1|nr:serine/threonine-protein phosphatase 7 long form homolog [Asparagus officinalis]